MKIVIRTPVESYYKELLPELSKKKLFEWASLMFGAKLIRFDGHHEHDEYHLHFYFPFVKNNDWIGFVTEFYEDDDKIFFVDEGRVLPFFLASWKHVHLFEKIDNQSSVIVDDVDFSTPFKLGDYALLPFIYAHFFCRKSVYKFLFGKTFPALQLKKLVKGVWDQVGN